MQIFAVLPCGKPITLGSVTPGDTIADVKDNIDGKVGIPQCWQRLQYGGKTLENKHTLFDYNVSIAAYQQNIQIRTR